MYIVFFDLDNTILNTISTKIILEDALKKNLIKKFDFIKGVFFTGATAIGLLSEETAMIKWIKTFNHRPEEFITDNTKDWFNLLKQYIRNNAYEEIEYHTKKNAHIVLLSSAISYICTPLSSHLKMNSTICSLLEISNGKFTGNFDGNYCNGKEKLLRSMQYCKKNNFNFDEAFYYGDSINDLPILDKIGNPRCVSPDKKLKKIALKRRWKILNW